MQLQTVEQKLLTHDPTFGVEQTHAAISSQRSAFMSGFRPQYIDGDAEGLPPCRPLPMYRKRRN
jgi:actin-related protein 5